MQTVHGEGNKGKEVGTYAGESTRTAYDRGAKHEEALITLNEESPLIKHSIEAQGNAAPDFKMKSSSTSSQTSRERCQIAPGSKSWKGESP